MSLTMQFDLIQRKHISRNTRVDDPLGSSQNVYVWLQVCCVYAWQDLVQLQGSTRIREDSLSSLRVRIPIVLIVTPWIDKRSEIIRWHTAVYMIATIFLQPCWRTTKTCTFWLLRTLTAQPNNTDRFGLMRQYCRPITDCCNMMIWHFHFYSKQILIIFYY